MSDLDRIGPTAHFTASVWANAGLAHPALAHAASPLLFQLGRPVNRFSRLVSGIDMPGLLTQRHLILDALVEAWIEHRGITRFVELASGLSSRGARMAERFPHVQVLEGDLPHMARLKEQALRDGGFSAPNHQVVDIDLRAGLPDLPGSGPTLVVTEGLSYYLSPEDWHRLATNLRPLTREGAWLFDVALAGPPSLDVRPFLPMLAAVARARTYAHYDGAEAVAPALARAGYDHAFVHRPCDWADRIERMPQGRFEALFVIEAY